MIPYVSTALFSMIEHRYREGMGVTVEGSYIEIYQERIHDLLTEGKGATDKGTGLRLREDARTGIFVEGLSTHPVASFSDVATLIERGLVKRTVAATNMNLESSRSHSVFVLEVTQHTSDGSKVLRKSKLSLIDLAGSERVERTGATGNCLPKEGRLFQGLGALPSQATNARFTCTLGDRVFLLLLRGVWFQANG